MLCGDLCTINRLRSIFCIGLEQLGAWLQHELGPGAVLQSSLWCFEGAVFLFLCPRTAQFRASHGGIKVWAPMPSLLLEQSCRPT